ncbi:MAG TPA: glycosyltransferase family 2 protein [Nocardioidaceae bacterium]|nr:glycosyltransferase family 2 protein [Nocardioidaceae bacterium]
MSPTAGPRARPMASPKVSVVVATYNSPPGLDGLVASLDDQSLPTDEYETVFVDDGSSDDTFERLQRLAATRPTMRVDRIPSSGWPGRPRNVGTAMASGEYVFYADHDDYLFPEALERMYRFAAHHHLDVVHPKEVVKGWNRPGWTAFRHHLPRVDRLDQNVLQCITPHKLYRRSFLLENDIRFPEGRVRLEDFAINGLAWSSTDAIGVLADYPCYQWIIHEDNSHKASYDYDVYWTSFRASLRPLLAMPDGAKKDQLLVRWYRSRVLERVAALDGYDPEHATRLLATFTELLEHFPPHLDALLTPADRARSTLLRTGDRDLLLALADLDHGHHLDIGATRTSWQEGSLRIEVEAVVVDRDGAPLPLDRVDGRVVRRVPDRLRAATHPATWDLTDDLPRAVGEVVVRSRETAVDWLLPTDTEVRVGGTDGSLRLEVSLATDLDPGSAACGGPLAEETYDVFARLSGLGYTPTRRVPGGAAHRSAALVEGRPVVVFDTHGGNLALDLSGRVRSLAALAGVTDGCLHRGRSGVRLDLPAVHVAGDSTLPAVLAIGPDEQPARLVGRQGRAWVESRGRLSGAGPLRLTLQGRRGRPLTTVGPETRGAAGRAAAARTALTRTRAGAVALAGVLRRRLRR